MDICHQSAKSLNSKISLFILSLQIILLQPCHYRLLIFPSSVFPASINCFGGNMPQLFGNTNGNSYVYASDFSWTANLGIVGGGSTDTTVQGYSSSYTTFFVYAMDLSTQTILWNYYTSTFSSIYTTAVKLNPAATKVLATYWYASLYQFFQYFSVAGSLLLTFYLYSYSYYQLYDGTILVDANDIGYFIGNVGGYTHLAVVNLASFAVVTAVRLTASGYYLKGAALDGSYVVGVGFDGSGYGGLYKFTTAGALSVYKRHYNYGWSFANIYIDSANSEYHICDDQNNFFLTTSTFTVIHQLYNGTGQWCIAAYGANHIGYFFEWLSPWSYIFVIDWTAATYKSYQVNFGTNTGSMITASIMPDSAGIPKAYYAGHVTSLYKDGFASVYSFSYSTMFISSYNIAGQGNCITPNTSPVSSQSFTYTTLQQFNDYTTSYSTSASAFSTAVTYTMNALALTLTKISNTGWSTTTTGTLTASTIPAQTYSVTAAPLVFIAPAFTYSVSCSDIADTYAAYLSTGAALPSAYITFTPATRTFTVSTSVLSYIGTSASFYMRGTINGGTTTTTATFTLSMVGTYACENALITSASYPTQTYYLHDASQSLILSAFSTNVSTTYCGAFVYTAVSDGGSTLDTSVFTFSSTALTLAISTVDTTKAGTHTVTVSGYMGTYTSKVISVTITYTIIDKCLSAVVGSASYATQTYYLHDSQSLALSAFTSTVSSTYCGGSFVYTAISDGGSTLDTTVFTFSSTALTLAISTVDTTKVGTHTVTVSAQMGTYTNTAVSVTITYTIIDKCASAVVGSASYAAQIYYLHDPSQSLTLSAFTSTVSSTYCGGSFVYTAISDGGSTLDTTVFTFSPTALTLAISTVDTTKVGTHTVTVNAQMGTYTNTAVSVTVTYSIIDKCLTAVVGSASYAAQTYYLHDSQSLTLSAFTSTVSSTYCGVFAYTAISDGGSTLDTTVFTFSSTALTLAISTVDTTKVGTHTVTVSAQMGTYTNTAVSVIIAYTIIDKCLTSVVTSPTYSNITYYLYDPVQSITITPFTSTVSTTYCSLFTYNVTNDDTSTLDVQLFTFTSGTLVLTIYGTNTSYSGSHVIYIEGHQGIYTAQGITVQIYLTVLDRCIDASITAVSPGNQIYNLFSGLMTLNLASFAVTPTFCGTFSYTAALSDGRPLDAKLIVFDSNQVQFKILTTDSTKIGSYSIVVNGTFSTNPSYPYSTLSFILQVKCTVTSFVISKPIVGQKYLISSPALKIPFSNFQQSPSCGFFVDYTASLSSGGDLPMYVSFSATERQFIIDTSDPQYDGANLQIKLQGSINNAYYASQVFSVALTAPASLKDSGDSDSNSAPLAISDGFGYNDSFSITKKNSQAKRKSFNITSQTGSASSQFKAYIYSISSKGVVTVNFMSEVVIPENYTQDIDEYVLQVDFVKSDSSVNASLLQWKIQDFQNSSFTIQLSFDNPLDVSASSVSHFVITFQNKDTLKIKFLDSYYFMTAQETYIQYLLQISKQIPPQLSNSSAMAAMAAVGTSLKSSGNVIISSNMAVQFLLQQFIFYLNRSASLSQLWGMINALQIITCLPAFQLLFPSNAQFLLSMITSIANFDMINPSQLLNNYMKTDPTQEQEVPQNLQNIGFSTVNIIKNQGMIFGAFVISIVLAVTDILVNKLAMKLKKPILDKISVKLHKMVYYSMILRPLIEAYLNACIGAVASIYYLDLSTKIQAAESVIACIMTLLLALFPILTLLFLNKYKQIMAREKFKVKFESLYEGLKLGVNVELGKYQVPFFLFRRLLMAITICCIKNNIAAQLLIQSLVSLFYLRFLVEYTPYSTLKMNAIEIFNELTISSCFYLSYLFTEYVPESKTRYMVGWLLAFLVLFNVGVNFIGIIASSVQLLMTVYKRWKAKRRIRQTKVVPFEQLADVSIAHVQNNKVSDTIDFETTNGKMVTSFVDSRMKVDRSKNRNDEDTPYSHKRKNHQMFNSDFGVRA